MSKCITVLRWPAKLAMWLLLSCTLGLGIGAVGAVFHQGIDLVTELRMVYPWLLLTLPAAGALIVWFYRVCDMSSDRGTNQIFLAVRTAQPVRLRTAPLIFVSTLLTHLAGGSAGREGAALQLGGSIGDAAGRTLRLPEKQQRIVVMCGMAAAFTALFGTPLTAAVFAIEVVSVGMIQYAAMVPCLVASLAALEVAEFLGVPPAGYTVSGIPQVSLMTMGQTVVMGALCGLLAILFCKVLHTAPHLYARLIKKPELRAMLGGLLVLALTALMGCQDYNGAGGHVITAALTGQSRPEAFALKILFTAVTLGAGFRGGEIVPALFTGATFGCVAGPLLGLDPSFSAALGMVALFCGATNTPIASTLLAFELFGGQGLPLFALCCGVSYVLSGYFSLYSEQTIVFSKLSARQVDQNAT